ncbi:AbrB/MazE/SpoVT family DNA-binding domain-containing protein [Selenihalanaerobacter shriftii]|uniref:Transcriptional pleiotropic regulator of transition state genes n=1 Tax=Selenihalanaerobacter shriftii TaxID=142842 RepID=A0A1T4Q9B7_9FIRM|nr:AbrB/MazE/SpoVT family DNA-binding domain-containing protein [Selenihalanaerobacter shriftii]SJZ99788.1 transcriptional pleiotropic regulator of transition state genes [Selenihalanaerobacter shriftii]
MKSTGIVRKVDSLGRVVLPAELRTNLNIESKDPLQIFVDKGKIIFKKYEPACIFCGNAGNTIEFKNKIICEDCLDNMQDIK